MKSIPNILVGSNMTRHYKIGINKIENPNWYSHFVSLSFINTLEFKAEKVSRLIECTNFFLAKDNLGKLLVIYGFCFHMRQSNEKSLTNFQRTLDSDNLANCNTICASHHITTGKTSIIWIMI